MPPDEIIRYAIVYPDRRMVTRAQLTTWALDALANGDTDIVATEAELLADFALVRDILDDSGYATLVSGALLYPRSEHDHDHEQEHEEGQEHEC